MEIFDPSFWSFLWDGARYEAWIQKAGPWAPLMAIFAMIIVSFLPLPAETVAIANGMVFGQIYGFFLTWTGAVIAAIIAFALARWLGQPLIYRFMPNRSLARFERAVERRGAHFLLIVRMIPLIPYTIVNYGSGLSPVRFSTYLWTSAVGMAAPVFIFVSIGAMVIDRPWLGWASLAGVFLLFALLAWWSRKWWLETEPGS
ncbi:TVP38/TMEM64 family protein [Hyphococcus sp.]|uniref:TVP38/TMEM64 family protein n=1 Tax=Hyphococcus sp. TaxID=2038636 RepID=UPI003CCBFA4D